MGKLGYRNLNIVDNGAEAIKASPGKQVQPSLDGHPDAKARRAGDHETDP